MSEQAEKRLFPTILDDRARETPDRVYAAVPNTGKLSDGYRDITYKQVAIASNKVAWWLEENAGKSTLLDCIAYIGPPDLRYAFLVIAAAKVGYKILFPLPSNSKEGLLELIRATNCKFVIGGTPGRWNDILEAMPDIRALPIIPSFDDLLSQNSVKPYPYTKTYSEAKDEALHIIQTSGTTGTPKPIEYTHYMVTAFYRERDASHPGNPAATFLYSNHRVLNPLPPSWVFGLAMILHLPIGFDAIPVLLPADAPMPMTAAYIDLIHQFVELDGGVYVPDTLKQIAKSPEYLKTMKDKKLKFIMYGGAPLDKESGDKFADFLKV
jgi:acyl-CoA synthetase (AMP-forming)/AMP-acid ligase II